jgi:hypothetical protein
VDAYKEAMLRVGQPVSMSSSGLYQVNAASELSVAQKTMSFFTADVCQLPEEGLCVMKLLLLLLLETDSLSAWGHRVVVVTALGQQVAPSILNMGLFALACLKPVRVAPTGCQGCHLSGFPYIEAITRDVECNS